MLITSLVPTVVTNPHACNDHPIGRKCPLRPFWQLFACGALSCPLAVPARTNGTLVLQCQAMCLPKHRFPRTENSRGLRDSDGQRLSQAAQVHKRQAKPALIRSPWHIPRQKKVFAILLNRCFVLRWNYSKPFTKSVVFLSWRFSMAQFCLTTTVKSWDKNSRQDFRRQLAGGVSPSMIEK